MNRIHAVFEIRHCTKVIVLLEISFNIINFKLLVWFRFYL